MANPLRSEYQAKKRALEKAREIAERLQKEGDYYDMAARLHTAKKSLSVLETQWKRLQRAKTTLPKNPRTQKREKQLDLEILEIETQISDMGTRIKQIAEILGHLEKPLD